MPIPLTLPATPAKTASRCHGPLTCCALLLAAAALALLLPHRLAAQSQAGAANADIARGIQLLQGGNITAAKLQFTAAIKADRNSADALTWRGIAENQLKQYRDAVTDFKAALQIDANAQPAHYNLALGLIRLGETDAAIRELQTVVEANPEAMEAQYNLAVLLEEKHSLAQAAAHLNTAYRLKPNDLGVIQHLLADDLALKQTTQADELLEHLRSPNTAPDAQARIAVDLLAKGFFSQAAFLLEIARPRLAASADLDRLLARAYIGSGEDFKAVHVLQNSEAADRSGQTAYLEGLAYTAAGASSEALASFRAAVAANPRDAGARFQLGMLESHGGTDARAQGLQDLGEAARLDPRNASYAVSLGRALLEVDRAAEALPYLERARAEGSEEAVRNLLLGIAQASTTGAASAQPALVRAIAIDPSIALSHDLLGFCYFQVGDYAQAAKSYQEASDLSPQTARFAYDTALALDRQNRADEALPYAEKAVHLDPSSAMNHYLLGKLYGKLERKQEAVGQLETAIGLNPDLDYSYYLLARMYLRMGDTVKAQEWNAKFQQLKKEQFKLHGVGSMSSAPSSRVAPTALLNGKQLDPESSPAEHQ